MSANLATVVEVPITVHRQVRDGWFVYTCDQLPGLYVASQDDKKAYNDLPNAISKLVKLTFGVECIVALKEEHAGFEDLALSERALQAVADRTYELLASGNGDLSLVVQCIRNEVAHA
jgi:hypothetical protein